MRRVRRIRRTGSRLGAKIVRIRLEITKGEEIRYIGHLDYVRAVERAVRRAKLPVAYSEGFNPHMKMSFASALAVGVTSAAEYVDIEMNDASDCQQVRGSLEGQWPKGIKCLDAKIVPDKGTALMAMINLATYTVVVELTKEAADENIKAAIDKFHELPYLSYMKHSPKKSRVIDVKQYVTTIDWARLNNRLVLSFAIEITPTGSIKPVEVLESLQAACRLNVCCETALIHRTGLYVVHDGKRLTPLEIRERTKDDQKNNSQCHS